MLRPEIAFCLQRVVSTAQETDIFRGRIAAPRERLVMMKLERTPFFAAPLLAADGVNEGAATRTARPAP